MKKNYEKIYKKLIKEIKRMKKEEHDIISYHEDTNIMIEVEKGVRKYAIYCFNSIIEMSEEIEGKKCNMVLMNQDEFKKWKERITE